MLFMLQGLLLPCLCYASNAKSLALLGADAVLARRAVAGLVWECESRWWSLYLALGVVLGPLAGRLAHTL